MIPADQATRDRIATDLATTLVVEAAAGTGKTTALVGRIVGLVRTGAADLERVVAVTFTEKAAGEMKLRLREELERGRNAAVGQERGRLEAALLALEAMRIGTIHGLCADLLRERPVEARIDPLFAVADDEEALRLYDGAFEVWFQGALAAPGEGVRRILRRVGWSEDTQPRGLLWNAGWDLVDQRDFDAPWRRPAFDRNAEIDAFLGDLFDLVDRAAAAHNPHEGFATHLGLLRRWADEVRHRERVVPRDHDGLESGLRGLRSWKNYEWWRKMAPSEREFAPGLTRARVVGDRDRLKARLDRLVGACEADLAPCLREELRPLLARYEQAKERAGRLDFHDLLVRTRDLLVADRGVRSDLQRRFTHLLVDEFQDTDPLQADILLLLAAADPATADPHEARVVPGKLFIVGDPKQSIYRFRRADVAFYRRVVDRLAADGAAVLTLSTSFRGDPRIQSAVNAALEPCMTGPTQAGWVPLDRWRDEAPGRPAVVALPFPRQFGDRGVRREVVEESVPRAVAAWIDWLVKASGWTVEEDGHLVPIAARHVCLLFKRFQSFGESVTTPYAQALEVRGIAHVLVGGRSLHDREEVAAVRTALAAIERPDDELSVFATLKGPLFAVGDDALLAWREQIGALDPVRPVHVELAPIHVEVDEARAVLADLHRQRNRRPIADTLAGLLEATRAHAGLANWIAGEQVLANVERIAWSARRFEARGATSFRSFLEHLDAEARRNEAGQATVVEEGTEGVRIITVHGAKGLEFPVVVLCDPTCTPTWGRATRYVDPARKLWAMSLAGCVPADVTDHEDEVLRLEAEEATRLLYVASTRARDVLVVPVSGVDPLDDSWLAPLAPALYPHPESRRQPQPAPGCPPFGDDSAPDLPEDSPILSVRPGLHTARQGSHGVAWWDPAALRLNVRSALGLRDHDLLGQDDEGQSSRSLRDHAKWVADRSGRLEAGARPSIAVRTPTELAHEAMGQVPIFHAVRIERTDVPRGGRPHGKRFGVLVHAVLADVPLDAGADAVRASAALHGRLVGAPDAEVVAAAQAASAALGHDLLRRAAASPDCRREVPLVVREGATLVEGTADLAFLDPASQRWVVVDFKTDVELDALRAAYEVQLSWYVRAIKEATGLPADGILLQV